MFFFGLSSHSLISSSLKSDLIAEQNTLSKKYKEEASLKFKSEGNRIQYRFNEEILEGFLRLHKHLASSPLTSDNSSASLAADLVTKLKERNKLIRIADKGNSPRILIK